MKQMCVHPTQIHLGKTRFLTTPLYISHWTYLNGSFASAPTTATVEIVAILNFKCIYLPHLTKFLSNFDNIHCGILVANLRSAIAVVFVGSEDEN